MRRISTPIKAMSAYIIPPTRPTPRRVRVAALCLLALMGLWMSFPAFAQAPGGDAGVSGQGGEAGRTDAHGGEGGVHAQSNDAGSGGDGSAQEEPVLDEPSGPGAARTLPPVEPGPAVAPVFEDEQPAQAPERPIAPSERPRTVIQALLGLLVLFILAYLGGHSRVLAWEERLGISQVITTGFPFLVLGMIARLPAVGILSDSMLTELSPLLRISLGTVGFIAGFRFDTRLFQSAPSGTGAIALLSTVIPAAVVVGVIAPVLVLFSEALSASSVRDPVFVRDALILASAGAMTARSVLRRRDTPLVGHVIRLEAIAGIAGVAAVASFFRPHGTDITWHLPGVGWLLLTIGLGATLGLLFYAILLTTRGTADFLVVTLGSLSFAAGGAGYLHLSSVAVAFVAGAMLANFPGNYHERLRALLERIERPIYLLSLVVIGALWDAGDWQGWALMPLFMLARLAGKWLASLLAVKHPGLPLELQDGRTLAISPMGSLAVAIVVNAQLLYPGGSISLIVSAVVGGGVLTELFVQLASRRWFGAKDRAPAP